MPKADGRRTVLLSCQPQAHLLVPVISVMLTTMRGNASILRASGSCLLIRHKMLRKIHDNSGHPGFNTVYNTIKIHFFFEHMYTTVKAYINGCQDCKQLKGTSYIKYIKREVPKLLKFEIGRAHV